MRREEENLLRVRPLDSFSFKNSRAKLQFIIIAGSMLAMAGCSAIVIAESLNGWSSLIIFVLHLAVSLVPDSNFTVFIGTLVAT